MTAAEVECRLCSPTATNATTTYCERCQPVPPIGQACTGCGQPLLLAGNERCTRCRMGRRLSPPIVIPPRPEQRAHCQGCGAFTGIADGRCLGCRATSPDRKTKDGSR